MAKLTARENDLLTMAWQCFKTAPEIDYPKLQQMGNYSTTASATTCYLATRKKVCSSPPGKLTDGDRKMLLMAWRCFRSKQPQVDYIKLQQMAGYKNVASATTCFLAARKKALASGDAGEGSDQGSGEKKRKRAAPSSADEDSGTPNTKRCKKAQAAIKAEGEDEGLLAPTDSVVKEQLSAHVRRQDSADANQPSTVKQEDKDNEGVHQLLASAQQFLDDHEKKSASPPSPNHTLTPTTNPHKLDQHPNNEHASQAAAETAARIKEQRREFAEIVNFARREHEGDGDDEGIFKTLEPEGDSDDEEM
ncbi:hypothetical protein BDY17DRAFT_325443 [Neohortaea acidophila]|uniref:Uncharacterized protein n=1 Tax=Neohortaea acidophila TaxID=245834 RepID=A0A6A6PRT8_9PEZI|nr:uncharacterized protein BDY17DRAFT_325443 [Neohortaea acidophila]KAF2481937.1 hypothetical protein BDY17DRAFT_325443 [Neohortaea acidophila]